MVVPMPTLLPAARRPLDVAPDRLYSITSADGAAWIVIDPTGTVRAAGRLVAGWTLHRSLEQVQAAAERRGAILTALDEPVPA